MAANEPTSFLNSVTSILGSSSVAQGGDSRLRDYREHPTLLEPQHQQIPAVIYPEDTDSLKDVLRVASRDETSLWVVPCFDQTLSGWPLPPSGSPVMVDLNRMDGIYRLDESTASVLVEPGVTFDQLYQRIQREGYDLRVDCDGQKTNSVMGHALERTRGFTPYGDAAMMKSGMEVMLTDGTVVRTGCGAMPGNEAWELFPLGYGPYLDELFSQSNLGIVTKMGTWLMPKPSKTKPFMMTIEDAESLPGVLEVLRNLRLNQLLQGDLWLHSMKTDAVLRGETDLLKQGEGSQLNRSALKRKHNLGEWNLYGTVYGNPKNIQEYWDIFRYAMRGKNPLNWVGLSGWSMYTGDDRPDDTVWNQFKNLMAGVPENLTMPLYRPESISPPRGYLEMTFVAPTGNQESERMFSVLESVLEKFPNPYLRRIVVGWRSMFLKTILYFNRDDATAQERTRDTGKNLVEQMMKEGFGVSHSTGLETEIANAYREYNPQQQQLTRTLKNELDPSDILSTGRAGL